MCCEKGVAACAKLKALRLARSTFVAIRLRVFRGLGCFGKFPDCLKVRFAALNLEA